MAPSRILKRQTIDQQAAVGITFGAPPRDLSDHKGPIADFFRAAEFQSVLSPDFLKKYIGKEPQWGPIGYVTYKRTYARPLYPSDLGLTTHDTNGHVVLDPDTVVRSEEFWETLTRVLNGEWHIIRCHSARKHIDFDEDIARRKAEEAFERMWTFMWLPPGRGLWMTGTRFMYLKGSASLLNCGFISSEDIDKEFSEPFAWAMDMSMLGVGVGSDTRGADKVTVKLPKNLDTASLITRTRNIRTVFKLPSKAGYTTDAAYGAHIRETMSYALPTNTDNNTYKMLLYDHFLLDNLYIEKAFSALDPDKTNERFLIPDSREGWVESVAIVIDAFLKGNALPVFDYSIIRPKGTPIRSFGGVAEGPEPLRICHQNLVAFFLDRVGKKLSSVDIVDIFNEIGACVVAGGVRRSAQILLGHPDDNTFINLKHDQVNHPNAWNSNNSVLATVGMDYTNIAEHIYDNGEPGVIWMENIRKYGRYGDANYKDKDAKGVNPCGEQALNNGELCNLVENFPSRHSSLEDLKKSLKQSYLYAKTVNLIPSHSKRTNKVTGKNCRIGCSLSGVQNMRSKLGTREMYRWMDEGYKFINEIDRTYSEWFQCRRSIKTTSNKPSGTITKMVPEVDEGVHHPTAEYYLKNMIFSKDNYMVEYYQNAGYKVRPLPEQPDTSVLISFPVHKKHMVRTEKQAAESIFEQLELIAGVQEWWADNQVSVTIKFHPHVGSCRQQGKPSGCACRTSVVSDIKMALELYEGRLKDIAFLPYFEADQTAYAWLPEQEITAEEYNTYTQSLRPVVFQEYVDDLDPEECSVGGCPIR